MNVLVTGGAGYCGSVLVPKLLKAGHVVVVVDALWFGKNLEDHENLLIVNRDIREGVSCKHFDAVIHLAGIANDPCGELDAKLTWEVNVLATMRLADAAARAGVKQFIFASSASVYGLKGDKEVTEEDTLAPVSDYNKTKMCAERILLSYAPRMGVQIVRPATICGLSPRMRYDVMVNMLTMQAVTKRKITAHCGEHGGNLMRPNTHIQDICALYCFLIERPELTGIWNAGFENLSTQATAEMIAEEVEAEIEITQVKDKRSYAVDSSRLLATGFKPKHSVRDAIREIARALQQGESQPGQMSTNLSWMRSQGLAA